MEKKTHYVSIAPNEIVQEPIPSHTPQFEILADEEELAKLQELFDETSDTESRLIRRASTPYEKFSEEENQDKKNELYDEWLLQIYKAVHRLGTAETKAHIERMGILQNGGDMVEDSTPVGGSTDQGTPLEQPGEPTR